MATEKDTMHTYTDENNEIFDLLGMSASDKEKAAAKLLEEDQKYEREAGDTAAQQQSESSSDLSISSDEEARLNSMLDDIFSDETDSPAMPESEPVLAAAELQTETTQTAVSPNAAPEPEAMTLEPEPPQAIADSEPEQTQREAKKAAKQAAREAKKEAKKQARQKKKEAKEPGYEPDISLDGAPVMEETSDAGSKSGGFWKRAELVLFGPEEDDTPTVQELAAQQARKDKKERQKQERAEKKQAAEVQKQAKKQRAREMAVVKRAASQDRKARIREQEEAEDALEKRIRPQTVVAVAVLLLLLGAVVVLGTGQFSYHMAIQRATNYFAAQRYRAAYEQIVGVDVKDRDQKIKDKVYCVMYVQNQLDAYYDFYEMQLYENALDSLVKGTRKYNAHIEEARELEIASDLDGLKQEIDTQLTDSFDLSPDTVAQWLTLDQETYTTELHNYVSNRNFQNETAKAD